MNDNWYVNLALVAQRKDEKEEKYFLDLVDMVDINKDYSKKTLKALMGTYLDIEDYGTQERVESILVNAKPEDRIEALLEEMPRLESESLEWAITLLGFEINENPEKLSFLINKSPLNIKNIVYKLITDKDFIDFYPNAEFVSKSIKM